MKQKYLIITDWHLGAPYELSSMLPWDRISSFNENRVIFLGDIYDVKNCKKDDVDRIKGLRDLLLNNYIVVSGNNELVHNHLYKKFCTKQGIHLIIHGDYPLWGHKKAIKNRNKKAGAGVHLKLCGIWICKTM